jgi:hypothetical protein
MMVSNPRTTGDPDMNCSDDPALGETFPEIVSENNCFVDVECAIATRLSCLVMSVH